MPGPDFFLPQAQNKNADSNPNTLSYHRLSDKQLQSGIAAFEAGLSAQKIKAADPEHYHGTDPQLHFQKAGQCFTHSLVGQIEHRTVALAHGYLALIRFDGLDGQEKQQDITADMLQACEAIKMLAQTDKGLENMPQDFINHFKETIAQLHKMRPEYSSADSEEGKTWAVRLIRAKREYKEALEPKVGTIEARQQAEKFYEQLVKNISAINETFSLLENDHCVIESNLSKRGTLSPCQ